MRKKVTDRERLDWLDNQREDFRPGDGVYYRAGDYYELSCPKRSIRELIDAALSSSRSGARRARGRK